MPTNFPMSTVRNYRVIMATKKRKKHKDSLQEWVFVPLAPFCG